MTSLLAAPVEAMSVDLVAEFLGEADKDEGLTWEAKADRKGEALSPRAIRKAACAFANSRDGGLILVGATFDESSGKWTLPGLLQPPKGSLKSWLDSVIQDGVRPLLRYESRSLTRHRAGVQ